MRTWAIQTPKITILGEKSFTRCEKVEYHFGYYPRAYSPRYNVSQGASVAFQQGKGKIERKKIKKTVQDMEAELCTYCSTILIYLVKIGKLDLLQEIFSKVYILEEVFKEVVENGKEKSGAPLCFSGLNGNV